MAHGGYQQVGGGWVYQCQAVTTPCSSKKRWVRRPDPAQAAIRKHVCPPKQCKDQRQGGVSSLKHSEKELNPQKTKSV
eukprot:1182398-Prorocentrum_minimum.AAC.4